MAPQLLPRGGPYASKMAGLGGVPSTTVDDPITAVFLFLFACGAAAHMTIFQLNRKRSHKFVASGALFGFCMARITACVLRLVWSTHTTNISVAIAANIFFNAGVLIIIIINILFAQRVLRAMHPRIGWSRPLHFAFLFFFVSIPCLLVALITSIVQTSYTLNPTILSHDRTISLIGTTYFAVASFVPLVILLLSVLKRQTLKPESPIAKFGSGRFRTKILILLTSSTLICLGACFRAGIAYVPRPRNDPAWYHSKAAYYCFNFMIEIIVIYLYAIMRVDRRFHVPDGSSKVRHYSTAESIEKDVPATGVEGRVETEEEFAADFAPETAEKETDVEAARMPSAHSGGL